MTMYSNNSSTTLTTILAQQRFEIFNYIFFKYQLYMYFFKMFVTCMMRYDILVKMKTSYV